MGTLGVIIIGLTALSSGLAFGWYFGGRLDRNDAAVIRRKAAEQTSLWQRQLVETQTALARAESLVAAGASNATAAANAAALAASLAEMSAELDASQAQSSSLSKEVTEHLATIGELEEEVLAIQNQLKLEAKRQQEVVARLEAEKTEFAQRVESELQSLRAAEPSVAPLAATESLAAELGAARTRVATLESQLTELATRLSAQEHDWQQLFEEQNREVQALTTELKAARLATEERGQNVEQSERAARDFAESAAANERRRTELERELRALADENAQLKTSQSGFLQELETRDEQIIKFRAKLIELMRPTGGDESDEPEREPPAAVRTVTTDESDWERDAVIDDTTGDDNSHVERHPSRLRLIEDDEVLALPSATPADADDVEDDVEIPPPAEKPRRAAHARAKKTAPSEAAIHQPDLLLDEAPVAVDPPRTARMPTLAVETPRLDGGSSEVAEDDLTLLPGIGAGLARKLRALGYLSFESLATLSVDDGAELADKLGSLFRRNHSVDKLIVEAQRRIVL